LYEYATSNPLSFIDPFGLGPGDKWYGYNARDFQDWFHRNWNKPGDPDASKEDIQNAYDEWQREGKPKRDRKDHGRYDDKPDAGPTPEPAPGPEPEPEPEPNNS